MFPVNTEHLYDIFTMLDRRRRRRAGVVQMLCKCFVFAGLQTVCVLAKCSLNACPTSVTLGKHSNYIEPTYINVHGMSSGVNVSCGYKF